MKKPFPERIAAMNAMYQLPAHDRPTLPADIADRLVRFKATLLDEVPSVTLTVTVRATVSGASPPPAANVMPLIAVW